MRRSRYINLPIVGFLLATCLSISLPSPSALAAGPVYVVDTALNDTPLVTATICSDAVAKDCSLREAIIKANSDNGPSQIEFKIPANASDPDNSYDAAKRRWTIGLTSTLPTLTEDATTILGPLDSTTFVPQIVLDGSQPSAQFGFRINSSSNVIKQLIVVNFRNSGVRIFGPRSVGTGPVTGNSIVNSYIGAKPNDVATSGNLLDGIQISLSDGNTIGGTTPTDRNIIAGNGGDGILLDRANNNVIIYNYIGLTLFNGSFVARGNSGMGVRVDDSTGTTIGGTNTGVPSPRNYIANNGSHGILLTGSNTRNTTVAGNFIGLSDDGSADQGNTGDGVRIQDGANDNTISGGTLSSVISGNGGYGITVIEDLTTRNRILGNYIGTDFNGTAKIANDSGGISIIDGADNTIVGLPGQGNLISGNGGFGIKLDRFALDETTIYSNTLSANIIGLNADAAKPAAEPNPLANTLGGILLNNGSSQNRIGGPTAAEGNIIAGNGGSGIVITGTQTLSNTVQGNTIGLAKATSGANAGKYVIAAANIGDGISIGNAVGTAVGGDVAGAGNTIAANTANGIRIAGTGTTTTTLRFNTIGTTKPGAAFLPNLGNKANGILIESAAGPVQIRNSTIYSNTLDGVRVAAGVQRVAILDTSFTANGAKGIALGAGANHNIAPPFALRVNQAKQVTGRVVANTVGQPPVASACITCTIQFFAANPMTLDGEGRNQLAVTNFNITSNGYFTATLPVIPRQLAVTATDIGGNTSEFATLTITPSLKITNYGPSAKPASPTDTISYTFRVTNTGTLDLTDLKVVAGSDKRWTITPSVTQPGTLSLLAGQSAPLTLTLTLPIGTDPRVIAGTIDTSYITVTSTLTPTATASAQARTTVLSSFVLKVDPEAIRGEGVTLDPDQPDVRDYVHTLTNTGNLTGTVSITATTDLFNVNVPNNWKTTVDVQSVTLKPGESQAVTVRVQIPYGAIVPTIAKTTLKITQTDPLPVKTFFFTDTTTVVASRRASIAPRGVSDGAAAKVTTFEHTVTNLGNVGATFKISGVSNRGSVVSFRAKSPGITLGADGSFTLGTSSANSTFTFYVDVLVDPTALRGDTDVITITLSDTENVVVGGVQDVINVTKSAVVPRLYLPLIMKQ